jgi:RuvB-like protein 2
MLDIECFSFLNRALEGELAPLVIMASNRGMARIRGTKFRSPHGLPMDLLDRVLIVSTKPYSEDDIQQIIQIRSVNRLLDSEIVDLYYFFSKRRRCQEEDVQLTADASNVLTSMAIQTTLRYALNLIGCGRVVARKRKAEQVDVEDLRRAYTYFMDEKRSVQWLKEQQGSLIFEEIGESNDEPMDST